MLPKDSRHLVMRFFFFEILTVYALTTVTFIVMTPKKKKLGMFAKSKIVLVKLKLSLFTGGTLKLTKLKAPRRRLERPKRHYLA